MVMYGFNYIHYANIHLFTFVIFHLFYYTGKIMLFVSYSLKKSGLEQWGYLVDEYQKVKIERNGLILSLVSLPNRFSRPLL